MGTTPLIPRLLFAMLVGAPIASTGIEPPSHGGKPQFRAETRRVFVDVTVEEAGSDREPLEFTGSDGFLASDFEVLDNGIVQEDVLLVDTRSQPLSIVLVLDSSASVSGRKLERLGAATRSFLSRLGPDDDVSIIGFGTRFEETARLTSPRNALKIVERLRGEGATSLVDGMFAAIVRAETSSTRPVVVVFSDGEDNMSWLSGHDLRHAVRRTYAVIYAVRIAGRNVMPGGRVESNQRAGLPSMDPEGQKMLEEVTGSSGGRLIMARSSDELEAAFEQPGDESVVPEHIGGEGDLMALGRTTVLGGPESRVGDHHIELSAIEERFDLR